MKAKLTLGLTGLIALIFIVLPSSKAQPRTLSEVWFTSNVGTHDFLDMFTNPDSWSRSRSKLTGIKFYLGQLLADQPDQCEQCERNIFPGFMNANVFEKMKEWNLKVAVEVPAVKGWDCTGQESIRLANELFQKMSANGIVVEYLALDEPFHAVEFCAQNPNQNAEVTANYTIHVMNDYHKYYPNRDLKIALMEGYPIDFYPKGGYTEYITYFQALRNHGAQLAAVQMENDFWAQKTYKISDALYSKQLKSIVTLFHQSGWEAGLVFWGHAGKKPADYKNDVLKQIDVMKKVMGLPDQIAFQSWEETKFNGQTVHHVPDNLSESDVNSHTNLILKGLAKYGL